MLGVFHEMEQAIAAMPVEHSWVAQFMKLESWETNKAENLIGAWMEKEIQKQCPGASKKVMMLVWSVWVNLLEGKAIGLYAAENPQYLMTLVPLYDPRQAVNVAAQEIPARLPEKDYQDAIKFLTLLQNGTIKPDMEKILQIISSDEAYQEEMERMRAIEDKFSEEEEDYEAQEKEYEEAIKERQAKHESGARLIKEGLEELEEIFNDSKNDSDKDPTFNLSQEEKDAIMNGPELTEEEIDNSDTDPTIKAIAKKYLNGDRGMFTNTTYALVKLHIRGVSKEGAGNDSAGSANQR